MKNNSITAHSIYVAFLAASLTVFLGCEIQEDFRYKEAGITGELGISAFEYIQQHDSLALLERAITLAGLEDIYKNSGEKTFIAPTNSAFMEYLETNSYAALEDVPVPILRNALNYHIANGVVLFSDPALMDNNRPLPYETENGQIIYLSHNSSFIGLINEGTNKQWEITTSNLEPLNGALHVVNSIVYFSAPSGDLNVPDPSIKTDTIFPLYDTFINGGIQSGANFGADPLLKVKNVTDNGDYDRKAFLMFDLNEFDQEGVITDLQLEVAIQFTHGRGLSLDLYNVPDTTWTEMGLTWNSATFPDAPAIASVTTSKVSAFNFNITDFFNEQETLGRIALMLDGEATGDETNEFGSKENANLNPPMLIATIASGNSFLEFESNSGFTVAREGAFAWNSSVLELTGAAAGDIIYTVEAVPQHGWLVKGASILQVGDRLTQLDINVMNLLYINDGSGTTDLVTLSARDRVGSSVGPFNVDIAIQ
ncbi:MAG: DNRLRE domain-containing protein [Sediminicola sp.]|tara:strand:+ start:7013 stop:8458 length:1446 start_codon:yes stop_codon:yes gene_type:complete